MPGLIGAAVPSLSLILGWDTDHLSRAAADWTDTAKHWEDVFDSVHRGMLAPGGHQALDIPLAPPPDPSYPVNDVIAEATDLDGNHVVLRRGYYDAATKEGFGWDKIYWKHGLINPNVFKDLISHTRPKENQGGTLVYDVPINKAHCTSGFLGLSSCSDTGESLTMRIVANTNPTYDVPGGGQKGVITMYPFRGAAESLRLKRIGR